MSPQRTNSVICLLMSGLLNSAGAVSIVNVPVGDPGNDGDTRYPDMANGVSSFGSVDYRYNIGKHEVTAGEYTAFLNAVAKADTYDLYHTDMWGSDYGCKIQRSGSSGDYTYSVAPEYANRPVNCVSWGDATRFANWLHNGQPTGEQNASTTEDGSYSLNGAISSAALQDVTRKTGATWVIPTEDEWYKAAYYKGGSTNAGYWDYPTSSDLDPGRNLADASGNNANYDGDPYPIDPPYYTTVVGRFLNSASPYGTFDQGGNVLEWNEAVLYSSNRGVRGGSYYRYNGVGMLKASYRDHDDPTYQNVNLGFRVTYVGPDCNANGVPDDQDIANHTSMDCNDNGVPDECDLPLIGPGSWAYKAAMPTPRSHGACTTVGNKIYVLGGLYGPLQTNEEYDPATDTWTTGADMPTARFSFGTAVVNGRIYAIGGGGLQPGPLSTNEEYDPATDSWATKTPMPTANDGAAVAVNGKIYVIGGSYVLTGESYVTGCSATNQEYDPATDKWRSRADMPTARYRHSVAAVNGKIYVIGGWCPSNLLATNEEYDPATDTWTTKSPMPTPREGLAVAVVCGRILAIGGAKPDAPRWLNVVEEYDPVTDCWVTRTPMSTARTGLVAAEVGGYIYAIGGKDDSLLSENEVYTAGPDSDGDGIIDCMDNCPGTPSGEPADENGCSCSQRDGDSDGVNDCLDTCPDTPSCATVDTNGCPSDSDADGVLDGCDQCADSPCGDWVNRSTGCPTSKADLDRDGDVDPDDFGIFQRCVSGANVPADPNCQ